MEKQHSLGLHFHFQLRPLADIEPWPGVDGTQPHLGWFALSDGWYWIEAGSAELFRYSQPLINQWRQTHRGEQWLNTLPYVDYQVVRLWEDMIGLLPAVLEPIPLDLGLILSAAGTWATWHRAAEKVVERALPDDEGWGLLDAASDWWWSRYLDTAYLQAGPHIWFWSDGSDIHLHWDNRECVLDGLPAWEATVGSYAIPVADFFEEVQDFDTRFLARMHDRITIAQAEWSRPDVSLDSDLNQEQRVRTQWLSRNLQADIGRVSTDWNAVRIAIARIEALPGFPSDLALRLS